MTLYLLTPSVATLQPLDKVPSIYRNGSSPVGEADRAMQSVGPFLIAACAQAKPSGFCLISLPWDSCAAGVVEVIRELV